MGSFGFVRSLFLYIRPRCREQAMESDGAVSALIGIGSRGNIVATCYMLQDERVSYLALHTP